MIRTRKQKKKEGIAQASQGKGVPSCCERAKVFPPGHHAPVGAMPKAQVMGRHDRVNIVALAAVREDEVDFLPKGEVRNMNSLVAGICNMVGRQGCGRASK